VGRIKGILSALSRESSQDLESLDPDGHGLLARILAGALFLGDVLRSQGASSSSQLGSLLLGAGHGAA